MNGLSSINVKFESERGGLDCYTLGEQPMTCGMCGARTSFEEGKNGMQKHKCLNLDCSYQFIAIDGAEGEIQ